MTAIPYSFFCYHLTQIEVKWRPEDHRARIMVKGLWRRGGYLRAMKPLGRSGEGTRPRCGGDGLPRRGASG